ncbi:Helicase conserved C-terminal domain family protein [Candida albicans]|uniref:Helicase conserved C-terminal domain family protein n=1 Tax=Candida albicans TaxID=5476 RepID=A0A8H6BSM3_CANAX|nr:Helicase conserved C-terminal domain family protein [Candida albicans]KAF6068599.1 Helicase conserved C-terminal domain family protein [Candida albicans]KAF6069064.1 Helicase conserved C-terminal domain family protein [Candida albicans]KAF6069807.1 Helicase conserved C-terminal domain family protein [Candida albicans]
MSDHESDNYDSEPDIFEIIVSDSEDDSDMEDLFSAPATGTQNTTMDEECQVEEGVSRRRTVEGHHVSEDNEDYLQRTYGVKSTQYCFRLGKKHIYCRNFIIEERSSGNVVINPTARFYKRASRKVKQDLESVPVHQFTPDEKEIRVDDADLYEMVESKEETVRGMHCVSTQACVGIKKHVKLYMPREVVEGSNFDMKVRDEGYAQVTRSTAVLDQFFSVYEFDDKMSEPDSTAGYIDAGRKIYKAVYDDVIAQHDLANFLGSSLTYHFRNERFVRVLAPETVKQYGTCFGRMLSLIMASKDFDLCERVDTSIANELSARARVGDSRELMYVKLKQYVKNFVNYYPDDLVLVYYDWKETLYAHEAELRRSYGDGVVTVTADIEDMEGVQDVVRTAKVVLATKSFSCGIDLPNIRAIVFFDTDVPVAEMIQVIGRARNKVSHMVELYSNRDPDEVRCFRQQMAAFYGIRAACNNCCGVVDAEHEDMLRKLWEDEPEETNQYDEIVVVAETEEEKNWYDEIVDEAESIMQQIEMGNPVIGKDGEECDDGEVDLGRH